MFRGSFRQRFCFCELLFFCEIASRMAASQWTQTFVFSFIGLVLLLAFFEVDVVHRFCNAEMRYEYRYGNVLRCERQHVWPHTWVSWRHARALHLSTCGWIDADKSECTLQTKLPDFVGMNSAKHARRASHIRSHQVCEFACVSPMRRGLRVTVSVFDICASHEHWHELRACIDYRWTVVVAYA